MSSKWHKVFYLLLLFGLSTSEDSFEDTDKANDFLSQTHSHYDLRHTIPGEPDIDYPIYSAVPITSFSCAQRHEGYYADMESRCQAFRICTKTAPHTGGFAFLCPNGTLFSQRHFVCDWYRNVRCEESEEFYNENAHTHIVSTFQMMETVRNMIEYPMKTIYKALQKKPANTKNTVKSQINGAPTPTGVQMQTNFGKLQRDEGVQSMPQSKQNIYVNSLGELSTEPGAQLHPHTARILSKPEKLGRTLNLAESINFGLKDYFQVSNRTQKSNTNGSDLKNNLNILQPDINTKIPVQRSTSIEEETNEFTYLSHGFSKTKNDYAKSSRYQSPKQIARSSRNTSTNSHQESSHETYKQNVINTEDPQDFTTKNPVTVDSFLINSFFDSLSEPIPDDDVEFTYANEVEELFFPEFSGESNNLVMKINLTSSTDIPTTTTATFTLTTIVDTTDTTISKTAGESMPFINNVDLRKPVTSLDKVEKKKHLEVSSFLTDLKLPETLTDVTTSTTSPASQRVTEGMQTSTEMLMTVNAVETHERSHRRYNSTRNRVKTTNSVSRTRTIRPQKKGYQLRHNMTRKTESPTKINERRQDHSNHLHYSHHLRKQARITKTTTVAPYKKFSEGVEVSGNHSLRKLQVRNIENTSVARGNSLSTFESVRYGSINNKHRHMTTTTSTTIRPLNRNRQSLVRWRGSQSQTSTSTMAITMEPSTSTESNVENIIGKNIEIIPLNVSLVNATDTLKITTTTLAPTISNSFFSSSSSAQTNNTQISLMKNEIVESLLPFNELTRAIVDESILQNYRSNQQTTPEQKKLSFPTAATKAQTYDIKPSAITNVYPQGPNIVIAKAEGQRIDATSYTQLLQQQQPKITKVGHRNSYESLNDFLNKKFGQQTSLKHATIYDRTNPKNIFATQQNNQYFQQQKTHFPVNGQQQQTKHIVYAQPPLQQSSFSQSNILKNLQQEHPQLSYNQNNQVSANSQAYNYIQQPSVAFRNIKLPTLNNGIIPAVYSRVAQRRSDNFNFELETSTLPRMKLFTGASSYEVPLNSVGRLPNDKTQRLRIH